MAITREMSYRKSLQLDDGIHIKTILDSTNFFHDYEIAVAVELLEEALDKGEKSGYFFIFAEMDSKVVGYSCYGPIACTASSWDLFWIAVHQDYQNFGIGKQLLRLSESEITAKQGSRIYIETSSQQKYAPTIHFYLGQGYILDATLTDFYDRGDDKKIFVKAYKKV